MNDLKLRVLPYCDTRGCHLGHVIRAPERGRGTVYSFGAQSLLLS